MDGCICHGVVGLHFQEYPSILEIVHAVTWTFCKQNSELQLWNFSFMAHDWEIEVFISFVFIFLYSTSLRTTGEDKLRWAPSKKVRFCCAFSHYIMSKAPFGFLIALNTIYV